YPAAPARRAPPGGPAPRSRTPWLYFGGLGLLGLLGIVLLCGIVSGLANVPRATPPAPLVTRPATGQATPLRGTPAPPAVPVRPSATLAPSGSPPRVPA